jgi:Lar family restriction alleviation protein
MEPVRAAPCPFCGKYHQHMVVDKVLFGSVRNPSYFVGCLECMCQGPIGNTREEAIVKWNKAERLKP